MTAQWNGKKLRDTTAAPDRPLMIWDGECSFCRRWIERWARWTKGGVDFKSYQELTVSYPPLAEENFRTAVYLIEPNGSYCSGAEAVLRSLDLAGCLVLPYRLYRNVSLFAVFCDTAYYWVARHRRLLDRSGI